MNRIERTIEGCRYRVARADGHEGASLVRWNLLHWIPTFGCSGAWHAEGWAMLPAGATAKQAADRLLGVQ